MATWIPNQPVFFGDTDQCSGDELSFNQLVDNTDVTQFQLSLSPCISAQQLMPDPNFANASEWDLSRGWSISGGQLCAEGDTDATSIVNSVFQMTAGNYYVITIVVDSISAGGDFYVDLGAGTIGHLTATGTYTFYGFPNDFFGNTGVNIYPAVDGSEICISSIESYEILTNFIVPIYNSEGVYQTKISYTNNPTYFSFVDDSLTITIDWAELSLSNGCFYMCILDPCENTNAQNYPASITNGGFTGGSTGWTYGSHWVYSSNAMVGTYSVSESEALTQTNVFDSFISTYCVTVEISSGLGSVNVYFGTNLVDTISGVGLHTVSGICAGNFSLVFEMVSGTATIDSVRACEVSPTNYVCNMTSNTFKLADYSNSCTILVNACNNENGLGFNFDNSGFTPRVRLEAKLRQAKYKNERSVYEDSLGAKSVVYFSRRKEKDFCVDLQPEYIHDFLSLLAGFDNVYLDGVLYSVDDDEYSIEYSDVSDNLGKVKLLVSEKVQNVRNINCTDTDNVCNLGVDYLLKANDLGYRIVQTDGYGILING